MSDAMSGLSKIEVDEKVIYVIDYAGCNETEMMALVQKARVTMLENEKDSPFLILSSHENSYLTPAFMRYVEKQTKESIHRIGKIAFTGLDPVKKIIVKGYSLMFRRNFKVFKTREEAIAYLINAKTSDQDSDVKPTLHD